MAGFYKGFVFESGVSAPLTIEGRPIEVVRGKTRRYAARLPRRGSVEADTLPELARGYIEESGAIADRRQRTRAQLKPLARGKDAWNDWRLAHPGEQPMLAATDLTKVRKSLNEYDFSYTNFTDAILTRLHLRDANLHQAILAKAHCSGAHFEGANFCRTDLYETDFTGAFLTGANLQGVQLARTDVRGADLSHCKVYGLAAWDLIVDQHTKQDELRVTYQALCTGSETEEVVIVDGLDLAAFIYMTLNNRNIARLFEATGRKWVLLLGRFGKRLDILHRVGTSLRDRGYVPIVFDFSRSEHRDLIETVVLLAGMSAFVIVDITDPRSTPMELQAIAPTFGVPIVPIIKAGERDFGTFSSMRKLFWVLDTVSYRHVDHLIEQLDEWIIQPALARARALAGIKSGTLALEATQPTVRAEHARSAADRKAAPADTRR